MEILSDRDALWLCPACHQTTYHHPYAKPTCPDLGFVCSRCGNLIPPRTPCTDRPRS